jgi:hypothetical protein
MVTGYIESADTGSSPLARVGDHALRGICGNALLQKNLTPRAYERSHKEVWDTDGIQYLCLECARRVHLLSNSLLL